MKEKIRKKILELCLDEFISMEDVKKISNLFSINSRDIEKISLEIGITPFRYKRNQATISPKMQLTLFNSCVAIVGCGGLGGHIAENLTRVGIGHLILIDFDTFEEHNLNRQNFSSYENIGKKKVAVLKEELLKINPTIKIETHIKEFIPKEDFYLLKKSNVIVDALDDPKVKLELSFLAKNYEKNFVHGAIAGFSGQFCTNSTLENLYRSTDKGAEIFVGNPSFSVTFAASMQTSEILKLILNIGQNLEDTVLMTNLLENEFILL